MCERNEERFTGVRTNLGKVEEEIGKAHDWSSWVRDWVCIRDKCEVVGGK